MRVTLSPREQVTINFLESDGEIVVEFNEKHISVYTDWPDSSGRQGTIYYEKFGENPKLTCSENSGIE